MEAIAFLPNMNENNIIIALPSAQVGENMFLKRNIDEFGNFLIQKFSQGDSDSQISQLIKLSGGMLKRQKTIKIILEKTLRKDVNIILMTWKRVSKERFVVIITI